MSRHLASMNIYALLACDAARVECTAEEGTHVFGACDQKMRSFAHMCRGQ